MWVYGVSSKIPFSFCNIMGIPKNYHWILCDIDDKRLFALEQTVKWLYKEVGKELWDAYPTPHGYHLIYYSAQNFWDVKKILLETPNVDASWVKIGAKRRYWFLISYEPILNAPVTYMKVHVPKIWGGNERYLRKLQNGWIKCLRGWKFQQKNTLNFGNSFGLSLNQKCACGT